MWDTEKKQLGREKKKTELLLLQDLHVPRQDYI